MTTPGPVLVYRPDGDLGGDDLTLAPPVPSLAERRVVVLDNGKPNAAYVMERAAQHLAERTGARLVRVAKKGPGGRTANAAVPCAPDVFEQVLADADVVLTGAADCGSCSAYSVHDAIELERAGVPTVVVTTTRFAPLVAMLATNGGLADVRRLVLDHPIGGTAHDALDQQARGAVDALVACFTGAAAATTAPDPARQDTPEPSGAAAPGTAATVDVADLRALVSADGADLVVERVVHEGDRVDAVHLRLVLPDEHCRECVMPGSVLASIAFDRLASRLDGLRSVEVADPRDEPDDQEQR